MKLVAYTRVSTADQVEHGQGLGVQRDAIRKWAKAHGHRIVQWAADEGVSGSNGLEERLGLAEGLAAIREGAAEGLAVARLDRLARDLVLQEQLLAEVWRMGGRVFSTSPSEDALLDPEGAEADPSRALIRRILGAVSDYERAMIKLRLRAGRQRKLAAGGFGGGTPVLGLRAEGGELVPDEREAAVVARILELREQGASLRAICTALEAEGLRPKRGQRWYPDTVRDVLQRHGSR